MHWLLAVFCVLFLGLSAPQATLISDDFNYPSGNLYSNNTGIGWTTPWARNLSAGSGLYSSWIKVDSANNLTYSGSGGYTISQTGTGQMYGSYNGGFRGMNRDLTSLTGTVWFSSLVQDTQANVHAGIQLNNACSTNDYGQGSWSIDLFGTNLVVHYNGIDTAFNTLNLPLSTPHLLVGRITFQSAGNNDRLEVWIDPANLTNVYTGAEPALFNDATGDMGANLNRAGVFGWGYNATAVAAVDALRFSDGNGDPALAFQQVTGLAIPEPSAILLVAAGVMLLVFCRRR
jgi:hypothetical protein